MFTIALPPIPFLKLFFTAFWVFTFYDNILKFFLALVFRWIPLQRLICARALHLFEVRFQTPKAQFLSRKHVKLNLFNKIEYNNYIEQQLYYRATVIILKI